VAAAATAAAAGGGQTGVNSFITIRNNTIHDVYGRDREAITSDGGFTTALGTVAAVDETGRRLTLTADPVSYLETSIFAFSPSFLTLLLV
jgi:hypothetical protein